MTSQQLHCEVKDPDEPSPDAHCEHAPILATLHPQHISRRNAVASQISFHNGVGDALRWCRLQAIRRSIRLTAEDSSNRLKLWRSEAIAALKGSPWTRLGFNAFEIDDDVLDDVFGIFESLQLLTKLDIKADKLRSFLSELKRRYFVTNSYHNFQHAIDVFQMCVYFLIVGDAIQVLSPLSVLALLLSALAHDVEHPSLRTTSVGVHSLAGIAGASVELHHAAITTSMLSQTKLNVLSGMKESDQIHVQAQMIECILATDISQDGSWRRWFTEERSLAAVNMLDENRFTNCIVQLLLRSADLSNVARPFSIACQWSQALKDEVMGNDTAGAAEPNTNFRYQDTIMFCELFTQPIFSLLVQTFPATEPVLRNMNNNVQEWRTCLENII